MSKAFVWKGETFDYPALIDKALKLKGKKQKEFVEAYCASGPYARSNVGYIAGYYSSKTFHQILKVFNAEHPIFGKVLPGPEKAFAMGLALGEKAKKVKGKG